MNCISLHQPWASAIAVGLKSVETRSWAAPKHVIGQPLAIAAARADNKELREIWRWLKKRQPVGDAFAAHGIHDWTDMPMGCVVATAFVTGSYSTNEDPPAGVRDPLPFDEMLGDFSENRHLWFLSNIVALDVPYPVVGRQGIFQWDFPQ